MTNRSPGITLLLVLVTFGIYGIVWYVQSKEEMVARGADIPTAWLFIVPLANFYWIWKWSEGVQHVTKGELSAANTFLLMVFCGIVGVPVVQSAFNKVA